MLERPAHQYQGQQDQKLKGILAYVGSSNPTWLQDALERVGERRRGMFPAILYFFEILFICMFMHVFLNIYVYVSYM